MSLVSSVITQIRTEVSDDDSIRWTDTQILNQIKRAISRASLILIQHGINFAKSNSTFSTTVGLATYALPTDFKAPVSLWDRTNDVKLTHITDDEYEYIARTSITANTYWRITGSNIELVNTPTEITDMILYYWPTIDTSAYAPGTTMPWSGRIDDSIIEYAALRLKNIDEMTLTMDSQLMSEMEQGILNVFGQFTPNQNIEGWDKWL